MKRTTNVNLVTFAIFVLLGLVAFTVTLKGARWMLSDSEAQTPVARPQESPAEPLTAPTVTAEPTQPAVNTTRGERYESVGDYFKAGNTNATAYRLGKPSIERKSFSASKRSDIHQENGGCCQVCGSTQELEVEHWRGLQNGGGNERENLKTLCHECHVEKTRMDKSLRRQRDKLLKAQKLQ